ncbi:MAG: hypothetical protein JWN15_2943 [Firmicutes bacterium]|nr:hypothetical protein [Bacillota bacterium]
MTRFRRVALAGITALALLLLLVDLHAAYTSEHVDSEQTMASGEGQPGSPGNKLTVYLSGDLSLAGALRKQLPGAIEAKELHFDDIRFATKLPEDSSGNPFIAIHIDDDKAIWTPVIATRQITASMLFTQGMPVDRNKVLSPGAEAVNVIITDDFCKGGCSEGRRQITVNTRAIGLVSLPYMRSQAAAKVAQEAVTLMLDGLPASSVASRWPDRATKLAEKTRGDQRGGWFSSFQRLEGCRGGVLMTGGLDPGATWALIYYDASRDALTDTLPAADVQARLPGVPVGNTHAFGATDDGRELFVDSTYVVTIPAGTCGLTGWQVSTH